MKSAAFLCASTLALSACTVGADFERPAAGVAEAYGSVPAQAASGTYGGEVDPTWWRSFEDPVLTGLVERLARQNLDLQIAAERIAQARAQRDLAASRGRPQVGADARYSRERVSENGTSSLLQPAPGAPLEYDLFQPQASASWELDLFGKVRRAVEAADARTEATIEVRNGIALAAISELALDYMTLRRIQAQREVVRRDLEAAGRRTALTRNRFANGVATTLDVAQAEALETEVAQALPGLRDQEAAMANAIALLLAEPPRGLAGVLAGPAAQPAAPPAVPVGLPGELMRRRPDVREAEARLHAATAETGVATASFLPSISLGGNFGLESLTTGSLFDWASRTFGAGPSISIPIFEGGRLKGVLALRRAEQREAAIAYRSAVLRAWHDVDDALTSYSEARRSRTEAGATLAAERRALATAERQNDEGVATQLDVITAQTAVFDAEVGVVRADAAVETSLVTLYKALGGGWEVLGEP